MFSRQCVLERRIDQGVELQISWIPEEFAKQNKYVRLKEGDVWESGWQVVQIGGRQSRQERIDRALDYKRQRRGSDI